MSLAELLDRELGQGLLENEYTVWDLRGRKRKNSISNYSSNTYIRGEEVSQTVSGSW